MQNIAQKKKDNQSAKESGIVLSIGILVSNHVEYIRNALEALQPLLKAIPSELIIIDTKGEETDGSIAICQEYTDKIYSFEWCNDFAAARNFCISHTQGEWFMYQDDDEWFEDITEIVDFFQSGEYKQYKSASYRTKDYFNREGGYSMGAAYRMVKKTPNTMFLEPIHEYLFPMEGPCKSFAAYTHHYGYVFDTEEQHKEHSRRNLSLLRPLFQKNPQDVRLRAQIVQECMSLEELEPEALALCKEALTLDKSIYMLSPFQWLLSTYVRLASKKNDWNVLVERAELVRKRFPLSAFARLAISVMELKACERLGRYERAEELLKEIKSSREYLLENPMQRANQSSFNFEVFLEKNILADAISRGIICLHKAGNIKAAEKWATERLSFLDVPQLSISLLVSNNIATVEKCMESLRPLLEQIPSELIVVDTVGEEKSDGSLAVAKKYADKIVRFEWCDDFAAARNAGLTLAKGEWFMFLDDDEWFDDVTELIGFFKSGEYLLFSSGTYLSRNYINKEGTGYSTATLGRMTKRSKNTRFVGTIHETFNELYLPCKSFSAFVHHYGYAYANEEEKRAHSERNVSLLKKALDKEPFNMRLRSQMAMELATFDNEMAMEFCENTFQLCSDKHRENGFQWQLSLVFRLHEALGTDVDEAEKCYDNLKQKFGFNETAENGICYQMTRICLIKEMPERAIPYIQSYFETLEYLQQHPKEQQLQMTADFARYQTKEACLEMGRFNSYCNYKVKELLDKQSIKQPDWIESDIKLTIGVLVSNNINTIRNCMESLKPILEQVSSELIIVDTVGEENSDGSLAVAKEYATKIIRFEWCNDFSAARNVCIDNARGEWFLYVDDDEWFDDVQEIIDFFNSDECDNYGQAAYYLHNYMPNGGVGQTLMGRFSKRTKHARFVGRVHEVMSDVYAPCKIFSNIAYHAGYCYNSEEERKIHQERNVALLKEELKEKGYTPHLCAQMIQELLHVEKTWQEGFLFYKECISVLVEEKGLLFNSYTQWILFSSVRYYAILDDREKVLQQAAHVQENYKLSETAQMAIAGIATRSAWLLEDYELTEKYVTQFLTNRDWLNHNFSKKMEQNALDFSNFFTDGPYITVLSIGAMCANRQGKFEQANVYWKLIPWEKVDNKDKGVYWSELNCTMAGLKALQEKHRIREKMNELVALLQTLKDAEVCVNECIVEGNHVAVQEVLSGMQEVAITVGTTLDQIVGEGTEEVTLLEEYCESVWKCSNAKTKEEMLYELEEMHKKTEAVIKKIIART